MNNILSETLDRMNAVNKQAVEAALGVNRIAVRTQGLLAHQQFALAQSCLAAGVSQLRTITEGGDPQGAVKASAALAVELGEKLVSIAQESLEIQVQARDELGQLLVGATGSVVEKAPAVAPAGATKSAPVARRAKVTRKKKAA